MKKSIAVVDYGLGNLFSIRQALEAIGANVIISNDISVIERADGVLLPGVGAFRDAMDLINTLKLKDFLVQKAQDGKPILGVCLGFQLLFERSYEFGETEGLGLFKGEVVKFPNFYNGIKMHVPFIGWNGLQFSNHDSPLLNGIEPQDRIYFVHSYYVDNCDQNNVVASCKYHDFVYPAIFQKKNISGVQGHPEKSGKHGLRIYKNWLDTI